MFISLKRFVRAICLPAFGHVLFGCFVQAFRLDVQALDPLLVSGCFIGVFCSDVLFESSVFILFVCFVGAVVLVLLDGFVRALALSLCFVRMLFWAGPLSVLFGFEV